MPDTVVALSVLVADDEEGIRNLLRHWLESHGHSVVLVASAHAAMRELRSHTFDLVITDVVMPDGDGFELIAAFRKAQPQTRVVAISGGGKFLQGPDCLKIALGLGAHAAVMKPFNWEQLQVGIDAALFANNTEGRS
jgi:DNA-binding NtrC family response regulator